MGLKVTFRGGGHSFDSQSLGEQVVISMRRLKRISPAARGASGRGWSPGRPGATSSKSCGRIGLVPAITVTTSQATAGGTLSGDCLSRFSPAYGKEGTWIEQLHADHA